MAVDGVDGSGKSTFTATLSEHIQGRPVVIVHVDDFLNPAAIRNARGRWSPEAHWLDLYDYDSFISDAVLPLRMGGDGWYRQASFDLASDTEVHPVPLQAPSDAIVLIEGLFLHRHELIDYWDFSIFLDVPFTESVRRLALRDGTHPDPQHKTTRRYVGGQELYFSLVHPWERASVTVDNSDFGRPFIARKPPSSTYRSFPRRSTR